MRIDDRVLGAIVVVQLIVSLIVVAWLIVLLFCVLARADTIPPLIDDRSAILMLHACDIDGCADIVPPQDDAGMPACMSTSQAVAAAWAATHPEWTIQSIWCSGATP